MQQCVKTFLLSSLLGCLVLTGPAARAEANSVATPKQLSKKDAVLFISATDFVKKKLGDLFSWTVGYDISKVNRGNLTPTINYVQARPYRVPPDGKTVLGIFASVDDPSGLKNISGVRADLSAIGNLPDARLIDSGLYGDSKAEDGIYTLQTTVASDISLGPKEIQVAVANKDGWLALAKANVDIDKVPVISEAKFLPEKIKSQNNETVTLQVKIDNPGGPAGVVSVTIDLRALGFVDLLALRNDGLGGDLFANDDIFSLQFVLGDFVNPGAYKARLGVSNDVGGYTYKDLVLQVAD
ncbi:hypothetical protein COT42_02370 [Candidatus Saganbacteria bacterium CG08_land_8_20_14_0_20_45_16]|uniref:CARDB domain-containing protein n=1 Tax=Candidatus Saganbacteria bacterium CG08_land_8_20_14_0_20_45_16 TaxID=2014293 RepID=A0A2H0Y2E7_UNCSA|nr:MAG: hypothetical protein COT42_02370 [Candidatus Saganbacteria bacterium CG08_land_8_20_14_0_20_45_16]